MTCDFTSSSTDRSNSVGSFSMSCWQDYLFAQRFQPTSTCLKKIDITLKATFVENIHIILTRNYTGGIPEYDGTGRGGADGLKRVTIPISSIDTNPRSYTANFDYSGLTIGNYYFFVIEPQYYDSTYPSGSNFVSFETPYDTSGTTEYECTKFGTSAWTVNGATFKYATYKSQDIICTTPTCGFSLA